MSFLSSLLSLSRKHTDILHRFKVAIDNILNLKDITDNLEMVYECISYEQSKYTSNSTTSSSSTNTVYGNSTNTVYGTTSNTVYGTSTNTVYGNSTDSMDSTTSNSTISNYKNGTNTLCRNNSTNTLCRNNSTNTLCRNNSTNTLCRNNSTSTPYNNSKHSILSTSNECVCTNYMIQNEIALSLVNIPGIEHFFIKVISVLSTEYLYKFINMSILKYSPRICFVYSERLVVHTSSSICNGSTSSNTSSGTSMYVSGSTSSGSSMYVSGSTSMYVSGNNSSSTSSSMNNSTNSSSTSSSMNNSTNSSTNIYGSNYINSNINNNSINRSTNNNINNSTNSINSSNNTYIYSTNNSRDDEYIQYLCDTFHTHEYLRYALIHLFSIKSVLGKLKNKMFARLVQNRLNTIHDDSVWYSVYEMYELYKMKEYSELGITQTDTPQSSTQHDAPPSTATQHDTLTNSTPVSTITDSEYINYEHIPLVSTTSSLVLKNRSLSLYRQLLELNIDMSVTTKVVTEFILTLKNTPCHVEMLMYLLHKHTVLITGCMASCYKTHFSVQEVYEILHTKFMEVGCYDEMGVGCNDKMGVGCYDKMVVGCYDTLTGVGGHTKYMEVGCNDKMGVGCNDDSEYYNKHPISTQHMDIVKHSTLHIDLLSILIREHIDCYEIYIHLYAVNRTAFYQRFVDISSILGDNEHFYRALYKLLCM